MPVEYGTCPCGGRYEEHHVLITMEVGGESISFDDVAQGRCPQCGSVVYKLDLLARLEGVMRERTIDTRINAPSEAVAQTSKTLATG